MKNILPFQILILASVLFTSCSGEDVTDLNAENINEALLTANITNDQLLGTWNLTKMETEETVDLNDDNVYNNDLLIETDCFNSMSITFNEDNTFSSVNARMDFRAGETDDKFTCMGTGSAPDTGTWDIEGDILSLEMVIDGTVYKHTKELTLIENSFSFKVEKWESEKYVTNDPTGTSAEQITIVYLEYTLPPTVDSK